MTTWTWSVNNRPSTGAWAMYEIFANFLAAGWTCKASGDGLSAYSGTGSVFSNQGASGANGLANNYAWFRIQDPSGNREFMVERGTANYSWGIAYSVAAHFTTGGSATAGPTATDGVPVWGSVATSTGSGGSYSTLFNTTDGTYVLHMGMADSSIQYSFWVYGQNLGGGPSTALMCWLMEYVTSPDTGDLDPTVHTALQNAQVINSAVGAVNSNCFFGPSPISTSRWFPCEMYNWLGNLASGVPIGSSGWGPGYEDVQPPAIYGHGSHGFKGYGSFIRSAVSNAEHYPGDVMSAGNPPVFGTKNYLCTYAGIMVPWPPGTDSVV
jgi:hypothetical protein